MSRLFIANTTKQNHEFHYWMPEQRKTIVKMIRAGSQEEIHPGAGREAHEYIVAQHVQFGLKPVNEIDRTKEFIGLCYQFDRPISSERMNETFEHNDEVLKQQAQERRKEAAIATESQLEEIASQSHNGLRNFEVEIVEEAQKGVDIQVNETIEVARPGRRGRPRNNN
ncbi:hypothetical protein [Herbaspirillum huttiense]|uniref:hypothetical protein n=1 Tax=Herbaspirillum huttiense TaxID=863372 RepID=UPI0031D28B9E